VIGTFRTQIHLLLEYLQTIQHNVLISTPYTHRHPTLLEHEGQVTEGQNTALQVSARSSSSFVLNYLRFHYITDIRVQQDKNMYFRPLSEGDEAHVSL